MAKGNNKKERLLNAADQLFLQKGVNQTTLADLARLSEVPLGNVYYYFKTKAELASHVIAMRFKTLQELLTKIDNDNQTPELQLKSFMQHFLNLTQDEPQNLGFMLTMLWIDLGKEEGNLFKEFLPLPEYIITWCYQKFEALGKGKEAKKYAIGLLTALHGICAMRHNPEAKTMLPLQTNFLEHAVGLS